MSTLKAKKYLFFALGILFFSVTVIPESLAQRHGRASLVTGDFNNDGIIDLAIANFSRNNVSVFLGTQDGFKFFGDFEVGGSPVSIVTADFNSDGNLDLATGNTNPNTVSVLFGNGTGDFRSPMLYAIPREVLSISAADFNNDGHIDIIVLAPDDLCVLLNNGQGDFSPTQCFPF